MVGLVEHNQAPLVRTKLLEDRVCRRQWQPGVSNLDDNIATLHGLQHVALRLDHVPGVPRDPGSRLEGRARVQQLPRADQSPPHVCGERVDRV